MDPNHLPGIAPLSSLIESVKARDEPNSPTNASSTEPSKGEAKEPASRKGSVVEAPNSSAAVRPPSPAWQRKESATSKPKSSEEDGPPADISNSRPTSAGLHLPAAYQAASTESKASASLQPQDSLDDLFDESDDLAGQEQEHSPEKPAQINNAPVAEAANGSALVDPPPQRASISQPAHAAPTSDDLNSHSTFQLYSPTRAEIDAHPITQHYRSSRDEVSTSIGTAPEVSAKQEPVATESRQEQPASSTKDEMADKEIKEGDEVSWQWSSGRPGGEAVEVAKEGEVSVQSKKGNTIKKNASADNPAVHISRPGNDVVKRASELDVEEEGPNHKEGDKKEETNGEKAEEKEDDAKTGEKRKADETAEEKKDEEAGDAKKQKTDKPKENGEKSAPKKKGRPAKKDTNGTSKAKAEPKKKREPKKAATESGEPRRSGRTRS